MSKKASRLMAVEYTRIYNEANRLYREAYGTINASMDINDKAQRLDHFFTRMIEKALTQTRDYEHAKTLYSSFPRPTTKVSEHQFSLSGSKNALTVAQSFNDRIDEIHSASKSAVKQAWSQLQESNL